MEENSSNSPIQSHNSDHNLEKLDAILDLISLDDQTGDDRREVVQPVPQEARGVHSPEGNGLLINFEDVEGDPGPSTLEWMRKVKGGGKAKGRGKPDFRRIRQLLDDEAPSSSDVDAGYELDSGLETPDGLQTPASSVRLTLPPRSPHLEGVVLPSRTISPFDLAADARYEGGSHDGAKLPRSPLSDLRPLPRSSYFPQASPLTVFTNIAPESPESPAEVEVEAEAEHANTERETETLSNSLPELTHESSDMSMDTSSSLSELTPEDGEYTTGVRGMPALGSPVQLHSDHSFEAAEAIFVAPEMLPQPSSLQYQNTRNTEDKEDGQSRALSLAYDELESLRSECSRLRSLVVQLPGFASESRHHQPGFDPDATIRAAQTIRRVRSDSTAFAPEHRILPSSLSTSQSSSRENEFISKIDQLVWRRPRDPSDVMSPSNLENLYERISLWETAVRTRYRQRQM